MPFSTFNIFCCQQFCFQSTICFEKQDAKDETYFNIMINEEDMIVERRISVACTDKRFFNYPVLHILEIDGGFVMSILSLYGSKFITFHSILQVHNHFLCLLIFIL
ncbi:vacuolar protein sorting-associated protein 13 [Caerostris extrusa]|uniref:Vacuolar protein sorting-associated protein 13 n=1 Tax=Caerostris extrusa TaxID=172846 RepID=A0AAV4MNL8_CAEEX|nr:vacuolar protein sorting-associated protein 13 [Caerostris extrusa]